VDVWCREKSVVEIGAGPYPSIAAARLGWKRAVAVDPIAKGYAEEGMLPPACDSVVYIEAAGEGIPLPAGFADLVIIENCLDHVADPKAVIAEIHRLLNPGGLVWLFVDLSEYADQMHPHPMSEARVLALMGEFQLIHGGRAINKAHPAAYGAYRGLWKKPGLNEEGVPAAVVRFGQRAASAVG
jgi:SAM-dependent methyltransferase